MTNPADSPAPEGSPDAPAPGRSPESPPDGSSSSAGRSGPDGPSGPHRGAPATDAGRRRVAQAGKVLGAEGEALAARWYEDHGYEILDRNWRRREGEVDLIVRHGRTVAFCEVKTRTSDRFGTGAESVLEAKQRRIRRLASRWLSELTPASGRARVEVRFDVVSITGGVVEVIEDAF